MPTVTPLIWPNPIREATCSRWHRAARSTCDPNNKVTVDQLNGGRISNLSDKDWELLMPYLKENENLFGISVQNDLLMKAGRVVRPEEI